MVQVRLTRRSIILCESFDIFIICILFVLAGIEQDPSTLCPEFSARTPLEAENSVKVFKASIKLAGEVVP